MKAKWLFMILERASGEVRCRSVGLRTGGSIKARVSRLVLAWVQGIVVARAIMYGL